MKRFAIVLVVLSSGIALRARTPAAEAVAQQAIGIVYHDRNGNQRIDTGEPGLRGVCVSNGRDVVHTDAAGRYSLPVGEDTILFVIKPAGWRTPLGPDRLPRFYYIHNHDGSPKLREPGISATGDLPASVDFPLYPQKEPTSFRMLLFGDTQVRNQREADYLAHDVVAELVGSDAAFGVTLGDIVFNEPSMFGAVNRALSQIGIPWYSAPGNHDLNFDSPSDKLSLETYRSVYGPPCFSFDYARVHFILLDTVLFSGATPEQPRGGYTAGIDPDQMTFLKNDLAQVPGDRLVVLLMHYPIVSMEEKLNMKGRQQLYRLIEKRPAFSASAHRHYQDPRLIGSEDGWEGPQPHFHLVHATVCGGWWRGLPDETGIPHATMSDGAPNGYSIVTFNGSRYSVRFKAARRPAEYQMNIYAPDEIERAQTAETEVLVNVFAGTDKSIVQMRLGDQGDWVPMNKVLRPDPAFVAMKNLEAQWPPEMSRKWGVAKPTDCPHMWRAVLPPTAPLGTHLITVRATDMFGQTFTASRVIRIL